MSTCDNRLLTVGEVAERCQVSQRTVFRWFSIGKLRSVRIGNIIRVQPQDMEAFLQAHSTRTTADDSVSQG